MKKLSVIFVLFCSLAATAQVKKVSLQASGLTCSMCSNAIFKSLQTLDFVKKVDANIKTSTFEVFFNPNTQVDFDKLKKKVEDAGFFVAGLTATINFDSTSALSDGHVKIGGNTYHLLNSKDQVLNGDQTVRLLDEGFVSAKEYKKNSALTSMECYKTGHAGDCCSKDGLAAGTRIFHIAI
ncbi:MAG: heavy-metal-associated domain-containing protein [Ferruginibacter sp.]